jgi:hypothetical protein
VTGDAERTKDRRPNMHKAGPRWAGPFGRAPSTSSEFIIYIGKNEVEQQFSGRGYNIVIHGSRRNL